MIISKWLGNFRKKCLLFFSIQNFDFAQYFIGCVESYFIRVSPINWEFSYIYFSLSNEKKANKQKLTGCWARSSFLIRLLCARNNNWIEMVALEKGKHSSVVCCCTIVIVRKVVGRVRAAFVFSWSTHTRELHARHSRHMYEC